MSKIVKFSKTYKNIISIKDDFYKNNKKNLILQTKINKQYKSNPIRKLCKNCNKNSLHRFIENFSIEYLLCSTCSHLNGRFQDTSNFARRLYSLNSGSNYSKNYLKDYSLRVKNIYAPKVSFLQNVLKRKNIKLMDIGCGGGHFLKALEMKKIKAIGYETSKVLSALGNKRLRKNKILHSKFDEIYRVVQKNKEYNTISLIEVLEHLTDPNMLLKAFKLSKAEYLYISVPLFSLSVFLENSFKNVYPRQLGGGHTHLYTEKSLNYLAKKYNLKIVGEWWFGTDFPDLYRSLIASGKMLNRNMYLKEINSKLFKMLDRLQAVLDENKICSEVHMIFQKKINKI